MEMVFVKKMIDKALLIEDEEKKQGYFGAIGSYMKLAYRTWNREHYVSDVIIKEDLFQMTDGKVRLPDDFSLDFLSAVPTFNRGRKSSNNYKSRSNSGRSKHRNKGGQRQKRRY